MGILDEKYALPLILGSAGAGILQSGNVGTGALTGLQTGMGLHEMLMKKRQAEETAKRQEELMKMKRQEFQQKAAQQEAFSRLLSPTMTPGQAEQRVGGPPGDMMWPAAEQHMGQSNPQQLQGIDPTLGALAAAMGPDKGGAMIGKSLTQKQAPFQFGSPLVDDKNNFLGWARKNPNPNAQSPVDMVKTDGTVTQIPPNARPQTATNLDGGKTKMAATKFAKFRKELTDDVQATRAIKRYWGNRKDARQGLNLLVDQFRTAVKTLSSETGLSEQELAAAASSGQVQGLMGRFRTDIVGGGVMTEKDAWRVLAALGGDVGMLQNKQVVGKLLSDAMEDKVKSINDRIPMFNFQNKRHYFGMYPELSPMKVDLPKHSPSGKQKIRIDAEGNIIQ